MNILVTGSNGQLGREIRAASVSGGDRYIFTSRVPGEDTMRLDVTDQTAVIDVVMSENVDVIVNCAGYTDVEKAEDDEASCELLNAVAPGHLARAAALSGGLLIHISTDYVFGGAPYNTPCDENRQGSPSGVYGRTKLKGEQAVIDSGCRYLIFRTAWLYSEYGKNFVKTMLGLISSKPEVRVVFDQVGTPTYACDLAQTIFRIIGGRMYEGRTGIYNYSGEGVCSWFDFAKRIAELAGNSRCVISPCHSSEYPSKVKRPAYSVLDKTKFKETFGLPVPYWADSLRKCIEKLV